MPELHSLETLNGRTWEKPEHQKGHPFVERADLFGQALADGGAGILLIQELDREAIEVLLRHMPYLSYHPGMAEGKDTGFDVEKKLAMFQNPIFWDSNRYDLDGAGAEWLTKNRRQGKGWGAKDPRSFTWVILRDRESGRRLLIINTHLDHMSRRARWQSARRIVQFARKVRDVDVRIIGGDFNCSPIGHRAPYDIFQEAGFVHAWIKAHPGEALPPTMNNFGRPLKGMMAEDGNGQAHIDALMVGEGAEVVDATIIVNTEATDHNGVLVTIAF